MKKIMLSLTALAMLAACSDNDNPTPEPPQDVWYLSGYDSKFSDEQDTSFIRIFYNADSTVKEVKDWYKNDMDTFYSYMTYQGGKLSEINEKDGGDPVELRNSYDYKNGVLSKVKNWSYNTPTSAEIHSYDTLYYNAAGKVIEMHSIYNIQPEYNNKKYILTWTGGNVTKVEMYRISNGNFILDETEVYTYGDRPNYFSNSLKDEYVWKSDNISFEHLSANNVTKVEMTEAGTTFRKVRTVTYTYNERNALATMSNLMESFSGTTLNSSYTAGLVFKYAKK
ncbi:membrane lipoprotein lipid attachment site-containing protein [Chitinophaga barathri]|uniref:DUF4595 domain-containing protein n=1 Tax=Chitinophaga barathri TaxID=1647451 RepID=A0A3N4MQJ7_9BACT|nr:membrane lipoprotein lipid attachment site-containing protein [Chitinophaga barathri]RPD42390.1 hypothetical protein EG028_04220 [Chitinophaga barathri]